MKAKDRLLRLSLVISLVLSWTAYLSTSLPHTVHADDPPLPVEALEPLTPAISPAPPSLPQDEIELRAALEALELARQQGPEAVLALGRTLRGKALDLAMPEILAAHRQVAQQAPPRPATAPVSEAEELAILRAQAASEAESRTRALTFHDDPAENAAPSTPQPARALQPHALASVTRTVGSGCTYATISAAIAAANPGDTLLIEGGRTFTENLTVPISLTLQGGYDGCASASTGRTTIDGSNSGRVFNISAELDVTLENLNLTNGNTGQEGGGVRFAAGIVGTGNLTLTNVDIYTNTATRGGGLWVGLDAGVSGENVQIYDNTATDLGGGLRLFGGRATFSASNIYSNTAPSGAGVYATQQDGFTPALDLPSSADIYDNDALTGDGLGGGLYLREGTVSLADCSDIYANNAIDGGGAYLITSTLTIANGCSEIMLNTATGNGGGVVALDSVVNLDDSAELYDNTAGINGGGAYLDNSDLWGDKASIHYNTADERGGGVYATNGSVVDMDLDTYPCTGPRCSQLRQNTATSSYGGGVYIRDNSVVDLRNTFVENNTAFYGGGVFAYDTSTVYVYNSLFARNDATSGVGDAILLNLNVTMAGVGNTLAYNDAGGAATGNAIGMTGGSSLSLHCSIIWGHTTSIDELGHDVTYSDIQGGYAGAGNLNANPLFVLPGSADFHLQVTSPVIDRCAYFGGMGTDFDNELRPVVRSNPVTPYDMGADEFSEPRVGINDGGCTYGTLSQAVAAAEDGDTIQVAADTFHEAVDITDKDLTIVGNYESDCTTPGPVTTTTILDASYHSGSAVDIHNNAVTLRNLRITGGNSIGGGVDTGAGLDEYSQVTLDNVHITGNTGTYGAGLYVGPRTVVTLTNGSQIDNNAATMAGGGARVWGTLLSMDTQSDINDNTAPHGGGVSVAGGRLILNQADMSGNQAKAVDGKGGAIYVENGGVVTTTGNVWLYDGNQAYDGAGIYADASEVFLGRATIGGNTASNWGGGIYLTNNSTLSASNVKVGDITSPFGNEALIGAGIYAITSSVDLSGDIFNNRAETQGGGMFAESSVITLTNSRVGGTGTDQMNQVTGGVFGAGLYFSTTHALLSNTIVASNTFSSGAGWGGGIVAWNGSVLTLTNDSRVERHHAPNMGWFGGAGAGLLVYSSTVTLDNSQVLSNTADVFGGGIYMVETSTFNILNGSVIAYNQALNSAGGAIAALNTPEINISNAMLRSNTAATDGGAIYIEGGTLDFSGGWTLRQNEAGGNGGVVAVLGDAVANFDAGGYSLVYSNRAEGGHGGMVYLGNTTTTKLHATAGSEMYVYANYASENGGALYAENGGYFDVYGEVNFDHNRADNGGAIYLSNGSRVWLDDYANTRPQLWDNRADSGSGGAVYAANSPRVECDGATFGQAGDGNQASVSGGAIYLSGSEFSADNCIFQDNRAAEHGGAIAAYTSTLSIYTTYPTLVMAAQPAGAEREILSPAAPAATACDPFTEQCSAFSGNVADSDADNTGNGGALYSNDGNTQIAHTYFYSNTAVRGGAIHQVGSNALADIANTLIYSNTATASFGAGIRSEGGAFTVTHVTLANNQNGAGYSQSNTDGYAYNSIAWGNKDGGFWITSGPLTGTCNIDQSGNVGASVDPEFVAPGAGENYYLRGSSPAIDACVTGLSPDLDNVSRPFGSGYDMGAYEYALDMAFAPDRSGSGPSPGVVIYTHTLTNTGGAVDTYTLTAQSSNGWSATLDPAPPIVLHGGHAVPVTVSLSIPADVLSGTLDTLVITATSGADPGLSARVTDTSSVFIPSYTLTVVETGNGTVTRDPDQPSYISGTEVTLSATPDPGWHFGQWSGDAGGILTTTTVAMNANKVVTATFLAMPPTYYTLTMATSGTGSGAVMPAAGSHSYLSGTMVVLTATADVGSEFAGWGGDASGANALNSVVMDGDKTVTAVFNLEGVCVDVTGVTLTPLTTGDIYTVTEVQFRADITPVTAVPYTYTVDFGTGPSAPVSTVNNPLPFSHAFSITGTQTVTLAAWSCAMVAPFSDTVQLTVIAQDPPGRKIYLPLVLRN